MQHQVQEGPQGLRLVEVLGRVATKPPQVIQGVGDQDPCMAVGLILCSRAAKFSRQPTISHTNEVSSHAFPKSIDMPSELRTWFILILLLEFWRIVLFLCGTAWI